MTPSLSRGGGILSRESVAILGRAECPTRGLTAWLRMACLLSLVLPTRRLCSSVCMAVFNSICAFSAVERKDGWLRHEPRELKPGRVPRLPRLCRPAANARVVGCALHWLGLCARPAPLILRRCRDLKGSHLRLHHYLHQLLVIQPPSWRLRLVAALSLPLPLQPSPSPLVGLSATWA